MNHTDLREEFKKLEIIGNLREDGMIGINMDSIVDWWLNAIKERDQALIAELEGKKKMYEGHEHEDRIADIHNKAIKIAIDLISKHAKN